jgi:hypothetical protein
MCTRNGRLPKGKSTTLTIALATSDTSASAGPSSEPLYDVVAEMRVRAVVVLGLTRLVCWCTGMGEVIRAGGEGSGNEDRCLDAPAIQFRH